MAGDEIEKWGGGWASSRCRQEVEKIRGLINDMEAKGLALGCWGIKKGCRETFTRGAFLLEAEKLGADPDVIVLARRHWSGLLMRDLSD